MMPINTLYCIGRNYVAHIAELQNEIPTEPLVFLKPNSSVLQADNTIYLPKFSQNVHYETELVLQIGMDCHHISPEDAPMLIHAYAVGLDLTARDVQDIAKAKGLPWTKAKGFRGAACLSAFVLADELPNYQNIEFTLKLNGELRQHGRTSHMIYPIPVLLAELANTYGLRKGDLVFTGTPEGVGSLQAGDVLELDLMGKVQARFEVASS